MSSSRLLLLRRGDHDSRLTEGFESLLDMESMCDVSITCGQYIVKAHRTVLSIFSPFFKRIFDSINNPMHYPFVVIKDMPYEDLRAIIDLMYRGEVTVAQDQFGSLKKSAKTLEVSELSDIITSYEENLDRKPKINLDEANTSSSSNPRNTRKRGRPKRYCEESDEELRAMQAPNKRQQIMAQTRQTFPPHLLQKSNNKPQPIVKKPLVQKPQIRFVEDSSLMAKPQTATRGAYAGNTYARPPTAIRGAHSAFTRPQTATRGAYNTGLTKPQVATRGAHTKFVTRGRGQRPIIQSAIKSDTYLSEENTVRRGRQKRGRPPRHSRDSPSSGSGLPLGTHLPVSLPHMEMDLENIFPNYNLNDVSSSTSNNMSIPITFEPTIKREQDSDSEVECIMSGSSPLPSGVVDDNTEQDPQSSYMGESLQPIELSANNYNNTELENENREQERGGDASDTQQPTVVIDFESSQFQSNIIIKQERNVSPINENESEITSASHLDANVVSQPDSTPDEDLDTNSETYPITSNSSETHDISKSVSIAPIIRFIKTERVSPQFVDTFHPIILPSTTESSENNANEVCQSNISETEANNEELEVHKTIKIERISPANLNPQEIDISNENDQNSEETVESSSKTDETVVERLNEARDNVQTNRNDIECVFSGSPLAIRSAKSDHQTPAEELNQDIAGDSSTTAENFVTNNMQMNTEICDNVQNSSDDNVIDVQDIAFECFFSNDDQQMQTYTSEVSSSSIATGIVNNQSIISGLDDNIQVSQSEQYVVTQSLQEDMSADQESDAQQSSQNIHIEDNQNNLIYVDRNAEPIITSYSIDNVGNNSPIHSDEECMLLDSPQHTGFEVTVGSEPHFGDDSNEDDDYDEEDDENEDDI